jgi:hypothetical protein
VPLDKVNDRHPEKKKNPSCNHVAREEKCVRSE